MKLHISKWLIASLMAAPVVFASTSAQAAGWANLKVKFVLEGDAPEPTKIDMGKDQWCVDSHSGAKVEDPSLQVNAENKGIANICIFPDAKKSGMDAKDANPDVVATATKNVPVMDNVKCLFEPHIVPILAGTSIVVKNSDGTGHNANFNFFANDAQNKIIPSGGQVSFDVKKPERAPTPVDCNVHPWMRGYVIVTETPYVGISNKDGELIIENLPAGKEIGLKVWHERSDGSIEDVKINGKDTTWKKGLMEITLKEGDNDLGTVTLTPKHFK